MPLPTTLGGSSSGFLPFRDNFNRGDGPLSAPWQSGGATWVISSGEVVNTPTEGSELLVNGGFSNWTGDDPDNWTVANEDANNYVTENPAGQAQLISPIAGQSSLNLSQAGGPSVDLWYVFDVDVKARVSGTVSVRTVTQWGLFDATGVNTCTFRADGTTLYIWRTAGQNNNWTIDDASLKQLTLNTLFSTVLTSARDVSIQVELDTLTRDTEAGVVVNLDNKDAPANFVLGYHDGRFANLVKCVAGTYTSLIRAASVYSAGANLRVIKSGTVYQLWYNAAQVGANQTISDAGIVSNTRHGIFSAYGGNQLDSFVLEVA